MVGVEGARPRAVPFSCLGSYTLTASGRSEPPIEKMLMCDVCVQQCRVSWAVETSDINPPPPVLGVLGVRPLPFWMNTADTTTTAEAKIEGSTERVGRGV